MDNIIFEKIWQDDNLIELKITAISKFVTAYQNCYIQASNLKEITRKIISYTNIKDRNCYIQMGEKEGNFTPAFSMKIERIDSRGHLNIEVDIEIADTETRKHRCCFYIESEIGAIDRLGVNIDKLIKAELWTKVELNTH